MTPTRLPARSNPALGQHAVNSDAPSKESMPGRSGSSGTERMPEAATTCEAVNRAPVSVSRCQHASSASKAMAVTRVSSRMSRRRSSLSATKFRYASISGWAGMVSVHTHSCWISSEKL